MNRALAHAEKEQLLRARDAEVRQIRMRRHPDLRAKGAAQAELVEVRVHREILERDRIGEPLAQVLHRASHGARVVRIRAADDRGP